MDKLIRPVVEELVRTPDGYVAGAGFLANAGLLGPERSYIAWWQGEELEHVDALANFSPNSISRYVKSEWFRIPVETGQAHVTGPYVDFLCTDEYVLTFTHPVFCRADGPVVGIVGMDVTVQRLERGAMPALRRIGERATLVNPDGRAIVSAAAGHRRRGPRRRRGGLQRLSRGPEVPDLERRHRALTHHRVLRNCRFEGSKGQLRSTRWRIGAHGAVRDLGGFASPRGRC